MHPHDNSHQFGRPGDAGAPAWQPMPTGPAPSMSQRLRIGDVVAIAGAAFVFFFSFAPFVRYPSRAVAEVARATDVPFDGWYSAWSAQMFMAPLTWSAMVAALGVTALALVRMATGRDPELLRFRASQLQVGLALMTTVVLLGYALSHKQSAFGIEHLLTPGSEADRYDEVRPVFAWGGYLMVVGSFACSAGALLNHFNVGPSVAAALAPAAGRHSHAQPAPVTQPQPVTQPAPTAHPGPAPEAAWTGGYAPPAQYAHPDRYGHVPPYGARHGAG